MSSNSVKDAGRPIKVARRPVQKTTKSAKSARTPVKKAPKSARRVTGKASRPLRGIVVRSPSVAPKSLPRGNLPKNGIKNGLKIVRTPSPPMQPVATQEIIMRHKYQVGETVYFTSSTFGRAAANGSYTVVKLLPSEGDDYQYRIKSSGAAFERVAKESQLDRV
jgi:hypothetical protein